MKSKAITTAGRIDEFRTALQQGIDGITRAAEIYVAAIDDNPQSADVFRDTFADRVAASVWSQFEAIGRKWMHPRLLMGGVSSGRKTTAIKRLTYSTQERIFERERFPLLTSSGDKLMLDILEATNDQLDQMCTGNHIRTLSEQRAWIESQAAVVKAEPVQVMPYTIESGRVKFRKGCQMTRAEIRRLLTEM